MATFYALSGQSVTFAVITEKLVDFLAQMRPNVAILVFDTYQYSI